MNQAQSRSQKSLLDQSNSIERTCSSHRFPQNYRECCSFEAREFQPFPLTLCHRVPHLRFYYGNDSAGMCFDLSKGATVSYRFWPISWGGFPRGSTNPKFLSLFSVAMLALVTYPWPLRDVRPAGLAGRAAFINEVPFAFSACGACCWDGVCHGRVSVCNGA